MKPVVSIVMGSDSDLPIMSEAAKILEKFDIPFEITVISAHRTPDRTVEFSKTAKERGIKIIIAGAGGAAALPGAIAAITPLPVIGVPIKTSTLNGVDSLYSMAQMPSGIPVATVAINGAANSAILAVQILGTSDEKISQKLIDYKEELRVKVEEKSAKLAKIGYMAYMNK